VNETADSRSYGMSELLDHAALLAHLDAALVVIDRMNARHTALARAASGRSGEQS
jgi:hypothetical protein